jgi:phosphoribosylglycinamide formyltransferase-1
MILAVLVSGRGSNLQAILDEARAGRLNGAEVRVVISDVPTAPALDRARAAGVEALGIDRREHASREAFEAALVEALRERGVDTVVLAGFMRLLGPRFLAAFPDRVVNIHPSLLPAFPGMHGVRQALAYGAKVAGCTVHLVDEGTDSGPVLLQAAVPVREDDDEASLAARILVEEHRLLPEAIRLLAAGRVSRQGRIARILPPR